MHHRYALLRLFLLVFLFTLAVPLSAQDLSQTYTSQDGMLTFSYPADWTVREDGGLINFSSGQAFLQINYFDYGDDISSLEILENGASVDYGFTEPQSLVIAGYAAVQASSFDQYQVVINFCGGVQALAIGFFPPDTLASYEATFLAILNSLRYGDGEPSVCRGSFEGLPPMTAANAAQVAQLAVLSDASIPVESVTFSPDEKLLGAGGADGSAWLWNLATGSEPTTLTGYRDGATSLSFGGGGFNLAIGAGNGRVWMWDVVSEDISGMLLQHSATVESVAFSPDGFLVASGSLDGSLRVWDLLSYSEWTPLVEPDDATPIHSVAFNPDGTALAAGVGGVIRLWDTESQTVQAELETGLAEIFALAFSPDGSRLVYGGTDSAVWVWDLAGDHHALLQGDSELVFALAFSPNGSLIASAEGGSIRLWDATSGATLATLATPAAQVSTIAFNPAGTLLASGGDAGGVVLWGTSVAGDAASETSASQSTGDTTSETTAAETTTTSVSGACTITAPSNANLRGGPGTDFARAGTLSAGQTASVDGQTTGTDGLVWYRLTDGAWVRSDVVGSPAECAAVPNVTP